VGQCAVIVALTGMNAYSTRHAAAQWSRHSCLDSVGINRREVVNERVTQERSSEPS
jgi:hypothetical protein